MLTEYTFAGRTIVADRGSQDEALRIAEHVLANWQTIPEVVLRPRRGFKPWATVTRQGVTYHGAPA